MGLFCGSAEPGCVTKFSHLCMAMVAMTFAGKPSWLVPLKTNPFSGRVYLPFRVWYLALASSSSKNLICTGGFVRPVVSGAFLYLAIVEFLSG
ncbi:hypothetical protein V6N13_126569 [Hibiscus sabdariffa]